MIWLLRVISILLYVYRLERWQINPRKILSKAKTTTCPYRLYFRFKNCFLRLVLCTLITFCSILLYRSCQFMERIRLFCHVSEMIAPPPPEGGGGGKGPSITTTKIICVSSYIFPLPANISYFCSRIIKWHHSSGGGLSSVKLASNLHKYLYSQPPTSTNISIPGLQPPQIYLFPASNRHKYIN